MVQCIESSISLCTCMKMHTHTPHRVDRPTIDASYLICQGKPGHQVLGPGQCIKLVVAVRVIFER